MEIITRRERKGKIKIERKEVKIAIGDETKVKIMEN